MEWILIALIPAALAALLGFMYHKIRAKARAIKAGIKSEFGDRIRLFNGCGIVDPPNRVPGVLALTDDVLIYESLIGLAGGKGRIRLEDVASIRWERAWTSRHQMVRKYRGAQVLEVTTKSGEVKLFVLRKEKADP